MWRLAFAVLFGAGPAFAGDIGSEAAEGDILLDCYNASETLMDAQACIGKSQPACTARLGGVSRETDRLCHISEAEYWRTLNSVVVITVSRVFSEDPELILENWGLWKDDIAQTCGVGLWALGDAQAEQARCWTGFLVEHTYLRAKNSPA